VGGKSSRIATGGCDVELAIAKKHTTEDTEDTEKDFELGVFDLTRPERPHDVDRPSGVCSTK
jgi:hypothetical protein